MKYIQLTQGKRAMVDDEDFERVNQFKWCFDTGYAARKAGPKRKQEKIWMHRFIMKTPTDLDTDHINRDRLDNRKSNLRVCTHSMNLHNAKIRTDNKSGIKGVSWSKDKGKWRVAKVFQSKQYHLGYYTTLTQAGAVFDNFNSSLGVAI